MKAEEVTEFNRLVANTEDFYLAFKEWGLTDRHIEDIYKVLKRKVRDKLLEQKQRLEKELEKYA